LRVCGVFLFLRSRITNQLNFSFGMPDAAVPDQFGGFKSELDMRNSTNALRVKNGGTYDVLITLAQAGINPATTFARNFFDYANV
jgi:hypothetical protein